MSEDVYEVDGDFDLVTVDMLRLDREWVEQPREYHKKAIELTRAERRVAEAKAALDLLKAELSLDIRFRPEEYNLPKGSRGGITEGIVDAAILMEKQYQKVWKRLIIAQEKRDLLRGHLRALEHKKTSLEMLVGLDARDYFSSPKASEEEGGKPKKRKKVRT